MSLAMTLLCMLSVSASNVVLDVWHVLGWVRALAVCVSECAIDSAIVIEVGMLEMIGPNVDCKYTCDDNRIYICQIWVTICMDNKIFWLIANDCDGCVSFSNKIFQQREQRVYVSLYVIKSNNARAVDLDLYAICK